jgi:hypothetical protein
METLVPKPPTRRWITRAVAAAPLALVIGLAACGGGSSKAASAPPSTTSTTTAGGGFNRAALQAFTTCMTQHGVTIPTVPPRTTIPGETFPPRTGGGGGAGGGGGGAGGGGRFFIGGGGGGVTSIINSADPATKAAFQACQSQLPAGFLQQVQQGQTALAAYRSCMQDHGVTLPANGGFGGGPGGAAGGSTTTTTPAYAAAVATCRPLLPARGPRNGGSTTTTLGQ